METVTDFIFLGSKITAEGDCSHEIKRWLLCGRKATTNLDRILKSRSTDLTLATKVYLVQAMVFPVVMYGCESWTVKKAEHWRINVFELWCWRRHKSPLDCKQMKPVNPKGNQSWIFIGRTDAEIEAPILWPPDVKNCLIGKDPDAGKDWRREKGMTEEEMVGWHYHLNGHEFEQVPGVGDGQSSLVCCGPWVGKNQTQLSDWTELNWGPNCCLACNSVNLTVRIPHYLLPSEWEFVLKSALRIGVLRNMGTGWVSLWECYTFAHLIHFALVWEPSCLLAGQRLGGPWFSLIQIFTSWHCE